MTVPVKIISVVCIIQVAAALLLRLRAATSVTIVSGSKVKTLYLFPAHPIASQLFFLPTAVLEVLLILPTSFGLNITHAGDRQGLVLFVGIRLLPHISQLCIEVQEVASS